MGGFGGVVGLEQTEVDFSVPTSCHANESSPRECVEQAFLCDSRLPLGPGRGKHRLFYSQRGQLLLFQPVIKADVWPRI